MVPDTKCWTVRSLEGEKIRLRTTGRLPGHNQNLLVTVRDTEVKPQATEYHIDGGQRKVKGQFRIFCRWKLTFESIDEIDATGKVRMQTASSNV